MRKERMRKERMRKFSLGLGMVLLLASWLSPGVQPVAGASDPVPVDAYWRRIEALAELLEEAEQNAPAIATAVDELAAIEAVVLADGQVLPLDNGNLVAVLRRDDVQAARARLAALQRARTLLGDTPTPAADQTFAQLDEILSRSEFGRVREPARNPSLLQRALEWLYERLFPWLDRVASQPGVEPLLAAASVVVMLAVLAYIFRSSWRQWAAEGRSGEDNGSDKEADLSSGKALERAQALAGASDYRRAVRYLYLHCYGSTSAACCTMTRPVPTASSCTRCATRLACTRRCCPWWTCSTRFGTVLCPSTVVGTRLMRARWSGCGK
jgi:hypothetical protein